MKMAKTALVGKSVRKPMFRAPAQSVARGICLRLRMADDDDDETLLIARVSEGAISSYEREDPNDPMAHVQKVRCGTDLEAECARARRPRMAAHHCYG